MQEFPPEGDEIKSDMRYLWTGPGGEKVYRAMAWLGLDKCPVMRRLIIVSPDGEQIHNQPWDTAEIAVIRPPIQLDGGLL